MFEFGPSDDASIFSPLTTTGLKKTLHIDWIDIVGN
jgi:hypothetical protein